jgi:hypothetical protein
MSNILFCHGYTTKYVIMNVKKSFKSLLTLTIAWKIASSQRSGIFESNLISDQYATIIFVTSIHNKHKMRFCYYIDYLRLQTHKFMTMISPPHRDKTMFIRMPSIIK